MRVRIPEAVIVGRNFSLLVEDMMFPLGYAHSPVAHAPSITAGSAEFQLEGKGWIQYRAKARERLPADEAHLLGIVTHFGHFFVDALERLFDLQARGNLDKPLLIDGGIFAAGELEARVVPQIAELASLLGIDLQSRNLQPIRPNRDYAVSGLGFTTLEAHKPFVSPSAFRELRRRLGAVPPLSRGDTRTPIFVGRSKVPTRRIAGLESLSRYLDGLGCRTLLPEYLPLAETAQAFRCASDIILPIGSAKFNLVFCRPGTRVMCVIPQGYSMGGVSLMIRHLCALLGLELAFYECASVSNGAGSPIAADLLISDGDVDIMLRRLDKMAQ